MLKHTDKRTAFLEQILKGLSITIVYSIVLEYIFVYTFTPWVPGFVLPVGIKVVTITLAPCLNATLEPGALSYP